MCLKAEFIFLVFPILQLFWFGFLNSGHNFSEIADFPTFSLLDLFDKSEIEKWQMYPLTIASLFEIMYVIMLSRWISQKIQSPFYFGLKIVATSYGLVLFLWVVIVVYLSVMLS
jgi:hypothetical protein